MLGILSYFTEFWQGCYDFSILMATFFKIFLEKHRALKFLVREGHSVVEFFQNLATTFSVILHVQVKIYPRLISNEETWMICRWNIYTWL